MCREKLLRVEVIVSDNLILEATFHHFCHMLLTTSKLSDPTLKRRRLHMDANPRVQGLLKVILEPACHIQTDLELNFPSATHLVVILNKFFDYSKLVSSSMK